ncbi:hypothetical protein PC39_13927 [Salinisphaera sp. PC39]|uniref:type II toxin-antitoxin system VapC family toxin n=1 Tax=Salinisphaera sp. PC39 TaxID=1304156 RepID=UPI00333E244A
MSSVLDASAALALIYRESGHERVEARLAGSVMSAANVSEVAAHLGFRGAGRDEIEAILAGVGAEVVPVDRAIALVAGELRRPTAELGLSLGDRLCLATARVMDRPAVTADRAWAALDLGIAVECIR